MTEDPFICHIERHFGPIQHGWSESPDGEKMPFQIVACKCGTIEGATAFLTLGLCRHDLPSKVSAKVIRHELVMTIQSQDDQGVPSILQQMGLEALNRGYAYLRGEVVGPRGTLFEGSTLTAVYVTRPPFFPDESAVYLDEGGRNRIIVGLLPITSNEAAVVRERGWKEFEASIADDAARFLNPHR